jgi:hypothetical protein
VNVERDVLHGLTAKQFRGWEHFAEIEPFTFNAEARADARAADIVRMIYNVNRGKNQRALALKDALLKFEPEEQRQPTQQELLNKLMLMSRMQAALVAQGEG